MAMILRLLFLLVLFRLLYMLLIILFLFTWPWFSRASNPHSEGPPFDAQGCLRPKSEGGRIRSETLIELKFLDSSFFELVLLPKLDKRLPAEQFEATVSQSTVPSPPLKKDAAAIEKSHRCCIFHVLVLFLFCSQRNPTDAWIKASRECDVRKGEASFVVFGFFCLLCSPERLSIAYMHKSVGANGITQLDRTGCSMSN